MRQIISAFGLLLTAFSAFAADLPTIPLYPDDAAPQEQSALPEEPVVRERVRRQRRYVVIERPPVLVREYLYDDPALDIPAPYYCTLRERREGQC